MRWFREESSKENLLQKMDIQLSRPKISLLNSLSRAIVLTTAAPGIDHSMSEPNGFTHHAIPLSLDLDSIERQMASSLVITIAS